MAEYGWGLSAELVQKARTELHEDPDSTADCIEVVREQIVTRPDIKFLRTDDAFVLRFLRARKFDTYEAFKLFGRYFEYRQNNPAIFTDFQASEQCIKEALYDGLPGVLEKTDHYGRKILVLYSANWDNSRYGLAAIYRALLLTLEKLIDAEECQINGFVVIVDWSQFTFRQSTWLNPKILKLMIEGLQDCFPARFSGVHFVNQPWYIEAVFKMLKPFLKEKNRHKKIITNSADPDELARYEPSHLDLHCLQTMIHFHGINLGTLHQVIHKEVLPAELGGMAPPYNNQYWAKQLVGDENFSFSDKHIYWPNHECHFKTRSKSFPANIYSNTNSNNTSSEAQECKGTYLDEEFFLID